LTLYTASKDGTKIAYKVTGEGPAIILLHGGGDTKEVWFDSGWVDKLKEFKIIAIDARGSGESDKPNDPDSYWIADLRWDIYSVADACNVDDFSLLGFSFGGAIAKSIAAKSRRVNKAVIIGHTFGASAYGQFVEEIPVIRERWKFLAEEQHHSVLDYGSLSKLERFWVDNYHLPSWIHIITQMANWEVVEPGDIKCPLLVVIGSGDSDSVKQSEKYLKDIKEQENIYLEIIYGLDQLEQFSKIDKVWPRVERFLKS
jgi:pimeloyl-ACP methyl ester carboxylesterase